MRGIVPDGRLHVAGRFRENGSAEFFWVKRPEVLTKAEPAEKLAEQQQHFGLVLTCAHEAYPGHHLQFVTSNQHPAEVAAGFFAHAVFFTKAGPFGANR